MRTHLVLLASTIILILTAGIAQPQEIRATITGVVTDPSGAGIAGAAVSARNTNTNLLVTTNSGADGGYTLPKLPPGQYELSAEAKGFRKFIRTGIALAVADTARVDLRLEIGAVADSITVTAELTGVELNQGVTGQLLANKEISQLPLNGRSFVTLLSLSTGVLFTATVSNAGFSGFRQWETGNNQPFMMQGGLNNTNAFLVEGGSMGTEGTMNWAPLTDSIDEIKVSTPASDASLGLSGGGVVSITLKSGTNQYQHRREGVPLMLRLFAPDPDDLRRGGISRSVSKELTGHAMAR